MQYPKSETKFSIGMASRGDPFFGKGWDIHVGGYPIGNGNTVDGKNKIQLKPVEVGSVFPCKRRTSVINCMTQLLILFKKKNSFVHIR